MLQWPCIEKELKVKITIKLKDKIKSLDEHMMIEQIIREAIESNTSHEVKEIQQEGLDFVSKESD